MGRGNTGRLRSGGGMTQEAVDAVQRVTMQSRHRHCRQSTQGQYKLCGWAEVQDAKQESPWHTPHAAATSLRAVPRHAPW